MRDAKVQRGDVLAGKYRVESVLGVGGMGVVLEVTHLDLLEPRAIKLMLPEALEHDEWVERFLREARAAARLRGEHVARVHDVGHLEDGAPYMVMEYLAGCDLRALLKQRGRVPVADAALWALQACEALAEAHAAGIVHRDLKLANLFLTTRPDGTACIKVLDFGVSKVRGVDDPEMTTTQAVLGSPTYMSPEQMRSARSVDARSDVWSLGVILHRLVTGAPPFAADGLTEIVALVLSTRPTPPSALVPDVPRGFDEVVAGCLERDLDRRFESVAALAAALAPFAPEHGPASAERTARLLSSSQPRVRSAPREAPRSARPPRLHAAVAADEDRSLRRLVLATLASLAFGASLAVAVALALSLRALARPIPAAPEAPPPTPTSVMLPVVQPVPPAPPPPAPSASTPPPPRRRPPPASRPKPPPSASAPTPSEPPPAPHRMFGVE